MWLGLVMLLLPPLCYLAGLPLSLRLRGPLRVFYHLAGALVAFGGSGVSLYLAAYTGEQGGIAAFFFQWLVIGVYAGLLLVVWVMRRVGK